MAGDVDEAAKWRLWEKASKKILKADFDTVREWLNLHKGAVVESGTKDAILGSWSEILTATSAIKSFPGFNASKIPTSRMKFLNNSVKKTIRAFKNPNRLLEYCENQASAVSSRINELASSLKLLRKFSGQETVNILPELVESKAREELNRFIRVGKMIRDDPQYRETNIGKIETILDNFEVECGALSEIENLTYTSTFLALAAPSMEGKSQSAFVFQDIRPLYFPISEAYPSDAVVPQFIYANFRQIVVALHEAAAVDVKGTNYVAPTASDLLLKPHITFWTLGFIKSLIEAFESKPQPASWMKIYTQPHSFTYRPASISELQEFLSSRKYCLFLDEFKTDPWVVLVRNLARAVGLRCVIANTNTNIANVIGKDNTSGAEGTAAWSLVVCRLNGSRLSILNKELGLFTSLTTIAKHRYPDAVFDSSELFDFIASKSDTDRVMKFLKSLIEYQIQALRPGIASFVTVALKAFCDEKLTTTSEDEPVLEANYLFVVFLEFLIERVCHLMCKRKPRLMGNTSAYLAKIGLLVKQSYKSYTAADLDVVQDAKETAQLCNHRAYLENHLFYISNPTTPDKWAFVTIPDTDTDTGIDSTIITVASRTTSSAAQESSGYSLLPWVAELTHFRKEELITALACFFVHSSSTVSSVLRKARLASTTNANYTYEASNERALSNSGNSLEVAAAACVADASRQRYPGCYTFNGVSGEEFVNNLTRNLIFVGGYYVGLRVHFPESLGKFLKGCQIPFIYGWNRDRDCDDDNDGRSESDSDCGSDVDQFESLNCPEEGVLLANFKRCKNDQEIDGRFGILVEEEIGEGNSQTVFNEKLVIVECKNHRRNITTTKLTTILQKCLKTGNVALSLVFGTTFVKESAVIRKKVSLEGEVEAGALEGDVEAGAAEIAQKEEQQFVKFCHVEQINVYRVIPGRPTYEIIPFEPALTLHEKPAFNCIIFEETPINQYEKDILKSAPGTRKRRRN